MITPAFEEAWSLAVLDVIKTAIALSFNGIYVSLSVLALYLLRYRRPTGFRIFVNAIAIMFVLAMTQIALQITTLVLSMRAPTTNPLEWRELQRVTVVLEFLEFFFLITNNLITESLLIYRCYAIWSTYSKPMGVIALPIFLLFCASVFAYTTAAWNVFTSHYIDSRIVLAFAFANNALVTALSIGRIWYTRRQMKTVGRSNLIRRYNTAIAMLLESATIYFLFLCVALLAMSMTPAHQQTLTFSHVVYGFGGQLLNLVPTLLIVQASCIYKTPVRATHDVEIPVLEMKTI
ncbi:hypothetical protein R3P38DRAFT_3174838 [Favolaschia claudopus]|uniref:Taste receptor type 2 n=1 Tax=Favolaschia claudopus TaxID=2862362 RepID=A0AAW0DDJ3_9AGAR